MIEPRAGVRNISPYTPGEPPELDFDRVINIANNESPYGASPAAVEAAGGDVQDTATGGVQIQCQPTNVDDLEERRKRRRRRRRS